MSSQRLAASIEREAELGTPRRADPPEPADRDRADGRGGTTIGAFHGPGVPGSGDDAGADARDGTGCTTAADVLLQLQSTHGNRYVQRLLRAPAPVVQPKLRLGPAGDRYEREADRLAEDLADPAPAPGREHRPASAGPRIARTAGRTAGGVVDPAVQQLVLDARGRGRPLPGGVRRRYEQGLGADFAAVRLHTDRRADGLNLRLRSSAFTAGHDIFFRRGEYDPTSDAGREMLTHELVHVVQQTGGGDPLVQRARKRPPAKRRRRSYDTESESEYQDEGSDYEPEPQSRKRPRSSEADDSSDDDRKPVKRRRTKSQPPKQTKPKKSAPPAKGSKRTTKGKKKAAAATTDIPVGYLDLDKMKTYLAERNLTTDQEPKPVSVGVVVWNINHLKADDDDDDIDDEVADVENEKAESTKTDDTAAISEAMKNLKKALDEKAAQPLLEAIDTVITELDSKATSKDGSQTRKEVSQLKRDILELQALNLEDVLTPGITAMTERAKDRGKSAIGVRAEQLEHVRALNRVWKRLVRLRGVLLTGTVRNQQKADAREDIRAALTKGQKKRIGAAIGTLLAQLPIAELQSAVSALKRGAVVDLTTDTFFQSPAVNLVLINEMNLGIKHLLSATGRSEGRLGLSQGPIMLARGQALGKGAKRKSVITTGTGDDAQQVVGRQYEYYPAVHRTGGEQGLLPVGTFYVNTSGEFAVQEQEEDGQEGKKNSAIPWNKTANTFRGIVVHRYVQGEQEFWAGILHTTPAGKDLERKKIWPQISKPLDELNKLALHFKIPLLVGGDFYIPAEGIVNKPSKAQRQEIEAADPGLLNQVKSWNVARNIFLTAAADEEGGTLDTLVDTVDPPKGTEAPAKKAPAKKATRKKAPAKKATGKPNRTKPGIQPVVGIHKPEYQRKWNRYRNAVNPIVLQLAKNKRFTLATALKLLAPGLNINVSWNTTLGAGDIGELDIIRNYRRPADSPPKDQEPPLLTMQRALDPLGYRIVEAGSPTNPKERGRGENKVQLADLFLVNEHWKTARSGIVTPGKGQLKPVDDAELSATKTYWKISDHSPVLMVGSTQEYATAPYLAFDMAPTAAQVATEANQAAWDSIGTRLAGLATTGRPVDEQIGAIKEILNQPLAGPTGNVLDKVRDLAQALKESIEDANKNNKLTDEQLTALAQLGHWQHPYYTVDVAEESAAEALAGKGTGQKPPGKEPPPGQDAPGQDAPGQGFAGKPPPGGDRLGGGLGGPGAGAPTAWPTGQMVNVSNSCYLAALVHVFASHDAFRDLLDPQTHPIAPLNLQGTSLQTQSGLLTLVTRLQNPQDKIEAADMRTFMSYLDQLQGVLVGEPDSTQKKKVTKQATKEAAKATTTGSAFGLQQDAAEVLTQVLGLLGPSAAMQSGIESTLTPVNGGKTSGKLERHPIITLSLGPAVTSVADALKQYSAAEEVQAGYPQTPHRKQLLFASLPQVLTIALSRFERTATGQTRKITDRVTANDPLEIPDECLTQPLKASLTGRKATYRLLHVVHHSGQTPRSGHYTSYGKLTGTSTWYKHDDTEWPDRRTLPGPEALRRALETGYIYVYVRNP